MSRKKQIISLIESCEKHEFDKVVKQYLEEEYGSTKIVFTDGNNDTGLDIRIFDFGKEKIQYQLTVQKSKTANERRAFEEKLKNDLFKANKNYLEYGFSNNLFFFYSYTLTNERIREYEKISFKEYKINLHLIDANRLAEESEKHIGLQKILFEINGFDFSDNSSLIDHKEVLLFDMVSFGKPAEFKLHIIEAFILQSLYLDNELTSIKIQKLCNEKFKVQESKVFYDKLLGTLLTSKQIIKSSELFQLSNNERLSLTTKNEQHNLEEKIFFKEIKDILANFNQENFIQEYIVELKNLYERNFNSDLNDLIENSDELRLYSMIEGFTSFVTNKLSNEDLAKELTLSLLKYCVHNKFIQKIAASRVYFNSVNYNQLQNYLGSKKKVFIDTSIAINALCYYYNPKFEYNDYFFKSAKNLILFGFEEKRKYYLPNRYIFEVRNHIKQAFNLIPFTHLPNFEQLGKSRNVLFNYYRYLSKTQSDSKARKVNFQSFLKDFGFSENSTPKSFDSKIEAHLKETGILIEHISKSYNTEDAMGVFDKVLYKSGKFRPTFTKQNDSAVVEFLSDSDVSVHPLQPVFVTWDKTFFDVHRNYLSDYPNAQKWLISTPNKLIDAYSLLKFSINSETVTENLLALISDDIIPSTHSLLDVISTILNPDDEVGLAYTNRLASIREEEIDNYNNSKLSHNVSDGEAVIDDIFYKLTHHYHKEVNKLDSFKKIFTSIEFIDDVANILQETIDHFYAHKKLKDNLYIEFDKFINLIEEKS